MIYSHEIREKVYMPRAVYPLPLRTEAIDELARVYIDSRGLSSYLAFTNGWYGSKNAGDTFPRVVIPALNTTGTPYWQARILWEPVGSVPRYQSPHYERSDSLVIVNPQRYTSQRIGIAEGPFDALALAELGFVGLALMGNNPPSVVWDHIVRRYGYYICLPVVLFSDCDSIEATVRWQAQLAIRGIQSRLVVPEVKDVAVLTLAQRQVLLENL